jgi:hypothetical protein
MLSSLAHEIEPKDRLHLAAELVLQAVRKVPPEMVSEMRQSLERGLHLDTLQWQDEPGAITFIVQDTIVVDDKRLDVMLNSWTLGDPHLKAMRAAWAIGYRVATRQENLAYLTKLLDKQTAWLAHLDEQRISDHGMSMSPLRRAESSSLTDQMKQSHFPTRQDALALHAYGVGPNRFTETWSENPRGVRDIDGEVWVESSPNYAIHARDSFFLLETCRPAEHTRGVDSSFDLPMLFVRESQK